MDKETSDGIRLIASVKVVLNELIRLDQCTRDVLEPMGYLLEGIGHIGTDNETALKWLNLCLWSLRPDGSLGIRGEPH